MASRGGCIESIMGIGLGGRLMTRLMAVRGKKNNIKSTKNTAFAAKSAATLT